MTSPNSRDYRRGLRIIFCSNLRMLNLGDKDLYDEKELLGCLLNSCWETIHLLNNNVKVENVEKTLLNIENTSLALFPNNKFFKSK